MLEKAVTINNGQLLNKQLIKLAIEDSKVQSSRKYFGLDHTQLSICLKNIGKLTPLKSKMMQTQKQVKYSYNLTHIL